MTKSSRKTDAAAQAKSKAEQKLAKGAKKAGKAKKAAVLRAVSTPNSMPLRAAAGPVIATVTARALDLALRNQPRFLTDVISWHAHVPFLRALVDLLKPALAVELGVHKGDSLLSTAEALVDLGQDGRIVGIDTWQGDSQAGHYRGDAVLADLMKRAAVFGPRVTLIQSTFDAALASFADSSIDLLHIDGLHTYEAVQHDFNTWRPKLSARGVVMFHDTAVFTGDYGVHRFWKEVSMLAPHFNFGFGNGLGILALGRDVPAPLLTLLTALQQDEDLLRRVTVVAMAREQTSLAQMYRQQHERLTAEQADDRRIGQAEIEQLNTVVTEERLAASARFAQLEQEIAQTRETAGSEISRLNALIDTERQTARSEINRLSDIAVQAEASRATLAEDFARAEKNALAALESERAETLRLVALTSEQSALHSEEMQTLREDRDRLLAELQRNTTEAMATLDSARAEAQAARLDAETLRDSATTALAAAKAAQEETAQAIASHATLSEDYARAEKNTLAALESERAETLRLVAVMSEQSALHSEEMQTLREDRDRLLAELQRNTTEAMATLDSARAEAQAARLDAETLRDSTTTALAAAKAAEDETEQARIAAQSAQATADQALTDLAQAKLAQEDLSVSLAQIQAANAEAAVRLAEAAAAETALHALVQSEQNTAVSEYARRDALVMAERETAQAEFDRLNREINGLHRDYHARLDAARLKSRAKRVFKKVAFPIFRALPLPRRAKNRLRLAIVYRYGQKLGLVPPKTPALATRTSLALRGLSSRYLPLARASTGTPVNLPPRSVSIIIPVYGQLEYTLRCIDAIALNTTDIDYEIIVVDDGSPDMTEIMLSARTDITYLRNETNLGFIGSCNRGLERATKTYVCYLNNDTEVTPCWLSALVDTFEMHPGVGLAGSQLIYPDGRLQEAGGIIWDDFSGWNWGRLQDPEAPRFTYARNADYCSGASILLPRALAEAIGGFDPEFTPAYGEDSDLAFRLRAMGLSTMYQPLSRVVHYEGVTSGTDTSTGVKSYQVVNAAKLKDRWAHVLPHHGPNGVNPDMAVERGRLGRILVVDQITPETDKDAGSITALELMLSLRDLGYKVVFIPLSNFTYIPDYTDTLNALGIESVLYPWARSVEDHLGQVGDIFDAVVIFRYNTALQCLDQIRRHAPRAKVIFHNSDLHFLREERAKQVENPDLAELRNSSDETKSSELAIMARSDCCIVHSFEERDLLKTLVPQVPVVVFPWIYEPRGPGKSWQDRSEIVFLGGYRHYPNVDAVLHYARNVAPVLEQRLHGLKFRAIGSNPPPEMLALASPQLSIDGFIEDLEPVLARARVMLVPLRYGAGLKGKIVTAMAHGLPVVTTSVGAEGMALTDGTNVIIADTPEEMADAVVRLYTDKILWERVSAGGLAFVAATTSRAAGSAIVQEILNKVDLPILRRVSPSLKPGAQGSRHLAAFGTPQTFVDIAALAGVARHSLYLTPESAVDLVLPSEAALAQLGGLVPPGVRLLDIGVDGRGLAAAGRSAVMLVDAFDDAAVAKAVSACAHLRGRMPMMAFIPPQMVASSTGFALRHMLSQAPVENAAARTPVHLRHAAVLQAERIAVTWVSDTTTLGFPAMTLALLRY